LDRGVPEGARLPDDDSQPFLQRSLNAFQENLRRSGPAAAASYSLIGAIILFGGLGYGLDAWLGTSPWFLLAGLLLGIVVGFYGLALTVWRR
jgi:F0F1-type ATP synthase assembly protein I